MFFIPLPNIYLAIHTEKGSPFYNTCMIISSTVFITRHIIAISQENLVYRTLFSFLFLAFLQSAKLPTDVFLPFVLPQYNFLLRFFFITLLYMYICAQIVAAIQTKTMYQPSGTFPLFPNSSSVLCKKKLYITFCTAI